jgi:PAS domain S-box-containing protein
MVIAVSLACLAIGAQLLLTPVVAVDSYQLFLGAVAVSSLYGGARAGLLTLAISCLGKFYFFMPPNILAVDSGLAVQTLMFFAVAGIICWIGGRFHASEQGLAAVLTGIADAVIATDRSGRIKFMNPAAEALSGWRHAAAAKRNITEVIHLRTAGGSPVGLRSDPNTRPSFTRIDADTILDSKAGCAIPIAGSVGTITNEAGIGSGSVIVLRDVTERVRAEQEREKLLQDLQAAQARVKVLSGMLPICAGCKNIRDERGEWRELETYIRDHSEADFSHGLCPQCVKRYYPELESESKTM